MERHYQGFEVRSFEDRGVNGRNGGEKKQTNETIGLPSLVLPYNHGRHYRDVRFFLYSRVAEPVDPYDLDHKSRTPEFSRDPVLPKSQRFSYGFRACGHLPFL